jgi:MFS family permease
MDAPIRRPWYAGVTRYQWLVLAVASAGWAFDAFEGQLFNLTGDHLLADILQTTDVNLIKPWKDRLFAVFLVGGTVGGIAFGSLADRFGRKPTMAVTILFYSVFSGLTFFASELWHVAALRFLVALGVGGEWAVAAALVAEVFPPRARAHASGIFHATSVFGTWLAALAGLAVGTDWRTAYLIGVGPALLVLAVRVVVREPERWERAEATGKQLGSFRELFGNWQWARSAILGVLLAAVGLGTFWGVTVAGQDLMKELMLRTGHDAADANRWSKFGYGIVQAAGGGLGLLAFGPLAERVGRRRAFVIMHAGALVVVPATCYLPQTFGQMLIALPLFGFFTLGIHAGYAVYFPELFPDHLRATGTGVCFNGGRLLAAPILLVSAELKGQLGNVPLAVTILGGLFAVGIAVALLMPETRGRPLPE